MPGDLRGVLSRVGSGVLSPPAGPGCRERSCMAPGVWPVRGRWGRIGVLGRVMRRRHPVGVAGYFIDIGVRHPKWPHGYILGVECDGASWHSSRSARDRDRLRQAFLERLGWEFHRIWSTDWFNHPSREAEKLRKRIDSRLQELQERPDFRRTPGETGTNHLLAIKPEEAPGGSGRDGVAADPHDSLPAIGMQVGDTVRVRYLDGDETVLRFTVKPNRHAPEDGIIHQERSIARSVLDAEASEEVGVLVGSYLRRAIIEEVTPPASNC